MSGTDGVMLQVLEIGVRLLPGTPRGAPPGICASDQQMPVVNRLIGTRQVKAGVMADGG